MTSVANWASQRRNSVRAGSSQRLTPTVEKNSDSDDDGSASTTSEDHAAFSPVPRDMLATIVILGADGNLSSKKILPTLYSLWRRRLLPRDVLVVGFARQDWTSERFRKHVFKCIYHPSMPQAERKEFQERCHYQSGQFNEPDKFRALLSLMAHEEARRYQERLRAPLFAARVAPTTQVRMYYMAVPPFLYADIARHLRVEAARLTADIDAAAAAAAVGAGAEQTAAAVPAPAGATTNGATAEASPTLAATAALPPPTPLRTEERFVLEKPFGRDTDSCAALLSQLQKQITEEEIYRIDHYLGKELVMNLLVLRFANVCFQGVWDRQHVKAVQVIFKEDFGTAGRGGYFDEYGIIRDVLQNHLLQVLALVAMEQPLSFSAEHIRAEKLKVLHACRPLSTDDVVTGQYAGYLDDPSVENKQSRTETFAAAVLHINNPRWAGVPFVLKAGKALTDSKAEVRVQFHAVPGAVSALASCAANELVIRVQPEELIYWKVNNKVPGLHFEVQQQRMDLLYSSKFFERKLPEAYERLLLEVLAADHSHFVSGEELVASWQIFTPALQALHASRRVPEVYPFGSRGPPSADALAQKYGITKFGGGLTPYVKKEVPVAPPAAHSSPMSVAKKRPSPKPSPKLGPATPPRATATTSTPTSATAVTVPPLPEPAILPVHVGAADAPPPLMPKPSEELPSLRPLDLSGA